MVITTKQMSKVYNLNGYTPPLTLKDKTVIINHRVEEFKLLGTWLSEDLKLTEHVNEVTSSCSKVLATLRKIKNMTPQDASLLFKASCYPNLTLMTPSLIHFPHICRKENNAFRMLLLVLT